MYYEHFGLTEPPFRITPDTRWFFSGGNRGAILDALAFAITNGEGIVKVVGEVGSGKTMLCRMLEVRLPAGVEVVYLANPNLSPDNILHAIAFELDLGLAEDASRLQVMQVLQRYLLERHGAGSQVVVFVEEAQSMPIETLEEIRLLSNLETQRHKLLQLVLFGQPELEPNLSAPHIRQLRERITHSFELPAFSRDEIGQYLDFRMRAAGYRGPAVFTPAAVRAIERASKGLIRRVNILADKSLLAAYAAGTHQVTPALVRVAVNDSEFGPRRSWHRPLAWVSITTGLAILATTAYLWLTRPQWPGAPPPATAAAPQPPSVSPPNRPAVAPQAPAAPAPPATPAVPAAPAQEPPPRASTSSPDPQAPPRPRDNAPAQETAAAPVVVPSAPEAPPAALQAPHEQAVAPEDGAGQAAAAPDPVPAPGEMVTAPAVAAGDPYLEARLAATREWLEEADPAHFSIQLMLVSTRRAAELDRRLRDAGLGHRLEDIYVYRALVNGADVVGVLLGDYARYAAARQDLAALPPSMKRARPFIRNVRDIRAGRVRRVEPASEQG